MLVLLQLVFQWFTDEPVYDISKYGGIEKAVVRFD